MGARLPPSDRPRRGGIKCEFCGRVVHTVQQLSTHQNSLHAKALLAKSKLSTELKSPVKRPVKKLPTRASQELPEKSAAKPGDEKQKIGSAKLKETGTEKLIKETPKMERKKSTTEASIVKSKAEESKPTKKRTESDEVDTSESLEKKTEFKCPKCDKVFRILFSAQKHIQKQHSVNSSGSKVPITDILQPITIEFCQSCNTKAPVPHKCSNIGSNKPRPGLGLAYQCAGCDQHFVTNMLFDIHVTDVHSDNSVSSIFPSEKDFTTWKEEMQTRTNCKYVLMGRYNNKQVYRCSNISNVSNNIATFCPSTIICTKGLAKGVQTNFYMNHYKHDYKEYTLGTKYQPYTVTELLKQARGRQAPSKDEDDTDLYVQFKALMESIVLDAAKINIATLKVLIEKALSMTSILTQYDEDEDFATTQTASNQIYSPILKNDARNDTLKSLSSPILKNDTRNDTLKSLRKRKVDSNGVNEKNTFSLANDKDDEKILKELDTDDNSRSSKKSKFSDDTENVKFSMEKPLSQSQSPSFNDSYKEFIVKATKEKGTTVPVKKRNTVKTKMGHFKPSPSPKKREIVKKDIEYEVEKRDSLAKKDIDEVKKRDSLAKKDINEVKKRDSLAKKDINEVKKRDSLAKKDIEYEVKERKNDCNILILKI